MRADAATRESARWGAKVTGRHLYRCAAIRNFAKGAAETRSTGACIYIGVVVGVTNAAVLAGQTAAVIVGNGTQKAAKSCGAGALKVVEVGVGTAAAVCARGRVAG